MSSGYEKKLKEIRKSEGLTQAEFADVTGINLGTIKNYESGKREVGLSVVDRVINSKDFEKYTIWLIPQDWYTARLIMERWGHGGLVTLGFHE